MIKTVDEAWDYLVEYCGVSEETLKVVTNINGYSMQTMEDVLYAVAGENSFNDEEDEDDDNED